MNKKELKQVLLNDILTKNTGGIGKTTDEVRFSVISALRDKDYSAGQAIVSDAKAVLPIVLSEVETDSVPYLVGKYVGEMDLLDEVLNSYFERYEKIQEVFETEHSENIPHINEIIVCINDNPGIRHGKLADMIGISKGALTPLMFKLEECGLVSFSRPGKYKYYYLTDSGEEYYKEKLADSKENMDIDYILENLSIHLAHAKNRDELLSYIFQRLLTPEYGSKAFNWKRKPDRSHKISMSISDNHALNLAFSQGSHIMSVPTNGMRFRETSGEPIVEFDGTIISYPRALLMIPLQNNKEEKR